jgi:hypothetical protein
MSSLKRTRVHTLAREGVSNNATAVVTTTVDHFTLLDIQSTSKSPRSYEQALYNALETSRHMKGSGRLKLR